MIRALAILTLLAGLAAGVMTGCRAGESLVFFGPGGPTPIREERTAGSYRLAQAVSTAALDRAFFLEYLGPGAGRVVRLLGARGEVVAERRLADIEGDPGRVLLPLPAERAFSHVVIQPPPGAGLTVLAMGLVPAQAGFDAARGIPTGGPQIESWRRDGERWQVELNQAELGAVVLEGAELHGTEAGPAWRLELVLEGAAPYAWARFRAAGVSYTGPERAAALITVGSGREERRFLYQGVPGTRSLFLYPALVPFVPRSVRVEPLAGSRLWLDGLVVTPGETSGGTGSGTPAAATVIPGGDAPLPGPLVPLPADLGIVLAYPPADWRGPLYELFAWNRFPEVLIFDTADYAVQSRFFKRLAFFVEKRGYRGRLVTDREVANLHGFNAHDYRAEDLARFFNQAAEQGFLLHPEEEQLRAILVANGILELGEGGKLLPGRGAVISVSRSSGPLLRRHLLTHEAFHGVFFSSEAYRRGALALWEDLGEGEREFWRLFFRWVGYDTDDPYLSANELQAYLLQQERSAVGPYFRGVTAGRLLSAYPHEKKQILRFLEDDPGSFERRFDALERSLVEAAGLEGGRVVDLTPFEDSAGDP